MSPIFRALSVAALLALAGCATNDASNYSQGPMLGAITPSSSDCSAPNSDPNSPDCSAAPVDNGAGPGTQVASAPAQAVAAGVDNLDISTFVDPAGLKLMGDTSKSEAASAQYYALQFGRVGAARTWTGDPSVTGSINVGPFVKVNNRDCRDFTDIVNVGPKSFTKRGTACRGDDGRWAVGSAAASGPATVAPAAASGIGASG